MLYAETEDFRSIPSAQLTLEQFHTNDAEVEYDPPSYIRNVLREANSSSSARVEDAYGYGRSHASKRVRLALPTEGDDGNAARRAGTGAGGSSVNALVAAANLELGKSIAKSGLKVGFSERKNGHDTSDSEDERRRGSGGNAPQQYLIPDAAH
jgi:hypothetical protein